MDDNSFEMEVKIGLVPTYTVNNVFLQVFPIMIT